jgi:hypothetical protein
MTVLSSPRALVQTAAVAGVASVAIGLAALVGGYRDLSNVMIFLPVGVAALAVTAIAGLIAFALPRPQPFAERVCFTPASPQQRRRRGQRSSSRSADTSEPGSLWTSRRSPRLQRSWPTSSMLPSQ